MFYRSILGGIVLSVSLATAGHGQRGPEYSVGFGSQLGPVLSGFHARGSASVPTGRSFVDLRMDALVSQRRPGDEALSSLTANLVSRQRFHALVPYGIAGAGINQTGNLLLTGGLGWALPAAVAVNGWRAVPLVIELQGYRLHRESQFTIGIGARL